MIAIKVLYNTNFVSGFVFQGLVVVEGLQGEQVGPGGPQVVGKNPPDLGHVLNHAKVVLNPETKLVYSIHILIS